MLSTKKLFTIATTLLCFLAQSNQALASFTDVSPTDPQSKAIQELQLRKVINGYPDNTFRPNNFITRGEFLKMVFKDVGFESSSTNEKTLFVDVPAKNWLAPYTKKAIEINAISANGAKPFFNPTKPITRVDAIKIGFAIEGIATPYYTDLDPAELFKDVSPQAWYGYLARAAKRNNIASLKQPELFWATHLMTRGDAAELIDQLQNARESEGTPTATFTISAPQNNLNDGEGDLLNNTKFGILQDVWNKTTNQFYDQTKVNRDELIYAAVKGMVQKLGDQYTVFEEPTAAGDLRQFLKGEIEGIGTEIKMVDGKATINKTIPGSPAEKANLQSGDIIQKINGRSIENIPVSQILELIRGNAGTTITLTIQGGPQTFDVTLTRSKVTLGSINGKMINGVAYIEINEFTKNSAVDFSKILNELTKQSPKGYIFDLRDNPGGYVESAIALLGHFVDKDKTVVSMKTATNINSTFTSKGAGELKGKTIIVLIDKNTASAAEIMAGAIQDYGVGRLLGTQSFGKGSVQEITNYSDKSLLKLSIAHWLTPNGRDINGIGLTPDIQVELDQAQITKGVDTQLQKALEIINAI